MSQKAMKTRWKQIGLVLLTVAGALTYMVACTRAPAPEKWPTLRIGYLPIAAELPLFVAIEEGFFREAKVAFELVRFTSSNELGNAASADRVDIMAGTASNVVFDIGTVSGKRHLVIAINPYSNRPGHVTDHLIVGRQSGIRELAQLRGRKVASFPGSVNRLFVHLVLEKHGVPRDSYTYLEMPPPNWQPALESGAVDAVSALEPQATQILKDGTGSSIFPGFYADFMPDVPLSGHWVAADYFKRHDPAQLAAFLGAYERAIRFCREHEDRARRHLVKHANVREDIVEQVNLNPWQMRAEIDLTRFQKYVDLLAQNKALQQSVNVQDFLLPK